MHKVNAQKTMDGLGQRIFQPLTVAGFTRELTAYSRSLP